MTNTIQSRLKAVRVKLGETQKSMAVSLDLGESTWQNYERGVYPPSSEVLEKLCRLGIDGHWLLTGEGSPDAGRLADRTFAELGGHLQRAPSGLGENFVLVPRYDVEAAAGDGTFTDREQVIDWFAFQARWVHQFLGTNPRNLVLIAARGDSMEPAIRHGDLLLVDTGVDSIRDDAIYVLVKFGEVVVKRVQRFLSGAVVVKSDNPAYYEETLDAGQLAQLQVAGRVRWIGRML